jgi:disulfide oxidoreductase YuzD
MKDAAKYGISLFPALIVDGKIVSEGQVYSKDEISKMLIKA